LNKEDVMTQEIEREFAERGTPGDAAPVSLPPSARRRAVTALAVVSTLAALAIAGAVFFGIRQRQASAESLVQSARDNAAERVSVVHPRPGGSREELVLPANMQAYVEAPIYARTHGYLKRWYFDIGAHVQQGQLMAEIETPEVDQQLLQARADLKSVQANLDLAHTTAVRWQGLLEKRAVSKQETDQAVSDYASKQAAVDASMANVRRLEQLQSYEKVYAPFDGVVTARQTDIGALIDGDSSPKELFHLAAIDRLRVFVPVPEVSAAMVREGEQVTLTSDEFPNQVFRGTLVRNSNAIDPATRTLNIEVDVDNAGRRLLPGSYAFVHINVGSTRGGLEIPSSTLLFRAQGLQVGLVREGHAKLVPITIGRDFGATAEVTSGLRPEDEVILTPSDSLIDGTPVETDSPTQSKKGGAQ
jgi:RND family efflux transporter MFP subunit